MIYDINGALVITLINQIMDAGNHTYKWNIENVHNGTYFIKIKSDELTENRRISLIK